MTTATATSAYELCDSATLRAAAWRTIGVLPYMEALQSPAIGEALLPDGKRVLITVGLDLDRDQQFRHSHQTNYQPIWIGDSDGRAELVLGETMAQGGQEEWLWSGLRMTAEQGPVWNYVRGGE